MVQILSCAGDLMGKISILPDTLCNQIAAGEVIERPAAVIKELLENSIDAGSRKISVNLLQGGRKEVRVADDGEGMNPDDALLALERYATSKIRAFDDLQSIRSLGFRGEALPSIASVSRFELITRERESISGTLIRIDGGILRDVRETGCPAGTTITVRDLFHNVPARRKFLRSVDTEMSHISDQFLRLSLAHPQIHFQLTHQERLSYDLLPTKELMERAGQVLGAELTEKLQYFSQERSPLRLRGLAGPPELQRTGYQSFFVYVNERPVRDRTVNHAILSAYDTLLPKGKFPVVVLFLDIPPELVDVNVHPTKREVRFQNAGQILEAVRDTLREALGVLQQKRWQRPLASPHEMLPSRKKEEVGQDQVSMENMVDPSFHGASPTAPCHHQVRAFPAPSKFSPDPCFPSPVSQSPISETAQSTTNDHHSGFDPRQLTGFPDSEKPLFSRLPFLGQLGNAYLLLESPDGLILIDQHAAHERILFDRLFSASPERAAQRLTRPFVLDLYPAEANRIRGWMEHLKEIGFEIERFGGNSFVVHAIPAALSGYSPEDLLRGLMETAHEEESKPKWALLAGLAKTAACHGAIRAGQKLQREEIRQLLKDLDETETSATCPHGRPLWWKLTFEEIARFFRRS